MNLKPLILIDFLIFFGNLYCQSNDTLQANPNLQIINNDTFFVSTITPVYIYTPKVFSEMEKREFLKYQRLLRNVKKAYPYAKIAADKLREVNAYLEQLHSKKEQKEYLDKAEREMREKFEGELKKLTVSQGKILIKLVYRETGNTTYEVVKELRGSFEAFLWQSLARLFGSNLKTKYDPTGEDADIEEIIQLIERGLI